MSIQNEKKKEKKNMNCKLLLKMFRVDILKCMELKTKSQFDESPLTKRQRNEVKLLRDLTMSALKHNNNNKQANREKGSRERDRDRENSLGQRQTERESAKSRELLRPYSSLSYQSCL